MRYQLTLEGETWGEIQAQAREIAAGGYAPPQAQAGSQWESNHIAQPRGPVPLPFEKPATGVNPPPEYVCPEHHQPMRLKPAGTNRQGAPYSAGYRCPVSGCRQFVPAEGVGVAS